MDRYVKRKGTQKKSATYSKKSKYLLSAPFPFKKKFDFGKFGHLVNVICRYSKSHDKYYENRSDSIFVLFSERLDSYPICTQLFAGFSFYFDGFLGEKTRLELVELVRAHGGDVEHFYSCSRVGIIIAKNVCYSKEQQYLKVSAESFWFSHRNPLSVFWTLSGFWTQSRTSHCSHSPNTLLFETRNRVLTHIFNPKRAKTENRFLPLFCLFHPIF